MPYPSKATDEQVIEAYQRTGSVWKAGEELGMCGQAVHERLQKLGMNKHVNVFTDEDKEYLSERYVLYRDSGMLQDLADEMGRTKPFICRQARALGLTSPSNSGSHKKSVLKYATEAVAIPIWNKFKESPLGVGDFCKENHYDVQTFTDTMNRYFPFEYDAIIESKGNRQTARARGMDFEFEVRDDMKHHEYIAMRTPVSKSPADVYAFKYGELVFIQCRISGALQPLEWNVFFDYCNSVGATPILAQKGKNASIEYWKLVGTKVPGDNRTPQPKEPWEPSEGAASSVNGVTYDHMDITVTFEVEA